MAPRTGKTNSPPFKFDSVAGCKIIRNIATDRKLFEPHGPHDFSIQAVASALDRRDVLIRTACGGGKTGTLALMAIVLAELIANPKCAPDFEVWYHKDPLILIICPTNELEIDIVSCSKGYIVSRCGYSTHLIPQCYKLRQMDITATAINAVLLTDAQNEGTTDDLWVQAKSARVVLM